MGATWPRYSVRRLKRGFNDPIHDFLTYARASSRPCDCYQSSFERCSLVQKTSLREERTGSVEKEKRPRQRVIRQYFSKGTRCIMFDYSLFFAGMKNTGKTEKRRVPDGQVFGHSCYCSETKNDGEEEEEGRRPCCWKSFQSFRAEKTS